MFKPDYKNIVDCAYNRAVKRIPLYEHNISPNIMERITGKKFVYLQNGNEQDFEKYIAEYCKFFEQMGYDTVTFEGCVTEVLPNGGALAHPRPGYIDGREKFESYPFGEIKGLYINKFKRYYDALRKCMPDGMKAIGGVGNGIFEIVQDLVGYENLAIMSFDDPELFAELFIKVGDMLTDIWDWFLNEYSDLYCVCRFGDDLGFRSNTLLSTDTIKEYIFPQYKRIVEKVHAHNLPFLLHSCGCIFDVMDGLIDEVKIDAKHSNEEQIAPMKKWVDDYGAKIGNFGGIDTDALVRMENAELEKYTEDIYRLAVSKKGGYALGSGNSIPDYVNPEKYLVMVNTVRKLRGDFD